MSRCSLVTLMAAVVGGAAPAMAQQDPHSEATQPAAEAAMNASIGVDLTTAYYFRGLRQEDRGFIVQPYFTVGMDAFSGEGWSSNLSLGVWNSFHDRATGSDSPDDTISKWYEADFLIGPSVTLGRWTLGAQYVWYTSPSSAFGTCEELCLSIAFDDSGLLGKWRLSPAVAVAFETGPNAADGGDLGVYGQVSLTPGFDVDTDALGTLSFAFPATLGVSLSDYYENAAGDDEFFGYFSIGARVSVPLGLPRRYGAWTFSAGVLGLFLGDHAADLNDRDHTELVGTLGLSASF